ncbi:DNA-binding protein [Methanococcus maripaludis]|nr:DNA-binding protein [Methanococcus maripaludis]
MNPEEIRQRRLQEMQAKAQAQGAANDPEAQRRMQEQQMQYEMQKQKILRQILSEEARSRLARIKLAKPQFAEQVEMQLIQLAQAGKLPVPLTDEYFKGLLDKIYEMNRPAKKEITIMRK